MTRWTTYGLAVWLGGLGCLLGCLGETASAQDHAHHAQATSDDPACTDGCCPAKEDSAPAPRSSNDMDCCIYLTAPPATLVK